jgi:hypothetical protein
MSSFAAPRCRHIKVNGTQCGSPALRHENFCFYHQQDRPLPVECYFDGPYATGEITLPYFEDAHSIQTVIRQVVQMVLQKRLERKTASLLLYALQIASSNLKRMELEKPQPEQVVIDLETDKESETHMAARDDDQAAREGSASEGSASEGSASEGSASEGSASESSASAQTPSHHRDASPVNPSAQTDADSKRSGEALPPGTIHACYQPAPYQPAPQMRNRPRQNRQRKQQYVI